MPWLTVHIAFPMLLTAGWSFEKIYHNYLSEEGNRNNRLIKFLGLVA